MSRYSLSKQGHSKLRQALSFCLERQMSTLHKIQKTEVFAFDFQHQDF
jgi:hypothetical protein